MRTERISNDGLDPLAGTAYRTIAELGAGGMGLVIEAEHRRLRKRVCVKLLRHGPASTEHVDRMQLEAQSLAALDGHPNVVLATDFGEAPDGRPFLVMERLHGRTLLEERNARGSLPAIEAIGLVCQVLAALEAAHALGVIHRDIKPGNLFVCNARGSAARVVKVLDFGAAKLANGDDAAPSPVPHRAMQTAQGMVIGSPRYMAPEQVIMASQVDHRVDLYAAGAVLFFLLTGRGPFDDRKDHVAIIFAQLHDTPPTPSTLAAHPIPKALDDAVLRALAKDPDDRFPDARSFAAELSRIACEMRTATESTRGLSANERAASAPVHRTPIAAEEPTMLSKVFVTVADAGATADRTTWWIAAASAVLGAVLGLYLLGVLR